MEKTVQIDSTSLPLSATKSVLPIQCWTPCCRIDISLNVNRNVRHVKRSGIEQTNLLHIIINNFAG